MTKVFQGAGIEGLVNAAKLRFSTVGIYSPTASRIASSETYLVCQRMLKDPNKDGTALDHVQEHLANIGIVVDSKVDDVATPKVGFRRIPKRE